MAPSWWIFLLSGNECYFKENISCHLFKTRNLENKCLNYVIDVSIRAHLFACFQLFFGRFLREIRNSNRNFLKNNWIRQLC